MTLNNSKFDSLPKLIWSRTLPWGTPGRVVFSNDNALIFIELFRNYQSEDSIQGRREVLIGIFTADKGEQIGELSLTSSHRLCCSGNYSNQLIIEEYGVLKIIDITSGMEIARLKNDPASYDRARVSAHTIFRTTSDGRFLYHLWGGGVGFYNLLDREFYSYCPIPASEAPATISGFFSIRSCSEPILHSGALSNDFSLGAVGGPRLYVLDLCQGGILANFPIIASALAFSSNRGELLVGTTDGVLNVFSANSWKQLTQIRFSKGKIQSLSLNEATSILVIGIEGHPLQFRHRASLGKLIDTSFQAIPYVAWHPFPSVAKGLAIDSKNRIHLIELQ